MARIVKWAVRLEAIDADGKTLELSDLMTIARDVNRADRDDFGLKLSEGKAILEQIQARIAQHQVDQMAMRNRLCAGCRSERPIHDYRSRQIQTLFGKVTIRAPRFCACRCEIEQQQTHAGSEVGRLLPGRTTPEFDHVLAELGARHSFREAARIMNMFVPTRGKHNHTGVRSRLGKVADQIEARGRQAPYRMSRSTDGPVSVFIDGNLYPRLSWISDEAL